jgi:hypothetical protein
MPPCGCGAERSSYDSHLQLGVPVLIPGNPLAPGVRCALRVCRRCGALYAVTPLQVANLPAVE